MTAHAVRNEDGVALVVALLAMALLSALGAALVLTTSTEIHIAANFRNAQDAFYAAEAVAERAVDDLAVAADWSTFLDGTVRSSFVDGPAGGLRILADGSALDLTETVNMANCAKPSTCSDAEMNATTADRPWGSNNPRWTLFAYGRLTDLVPAGTAVSSCYVVAMVGDDPAETDNNPAKDGASGANPGAGVLMVRAEAFGLKGTHKVIELTVGRPGADEAVPVVRLLTWREVREGG